MANYYAKARTNYFAVQDMEAFDAFCAKWAVEKIVDSEPDADNQPGGRRVGFMCTQGDEDGFPFVPCAEWLETQNIDSVDYDGLSIAEDLSTHLLPEHVAIGQEVGSEKYCYLAGDAWAINSVGEMRTITLHQISDLASDLGLYVTPCEY